MSVDMVLKNGQSGYDAVWEYVEKYWKQNGYETAIVALETSYDGKEYLRENEVVSPDCDFEGCEFLHDWWEGEPYIKILGIKNISEIEFTPTADVVEVVRCKDCAHKGAAFCMAGDFPLTKENENCYCSYGERRSENEG